ncbi:hypothetical protein BKA62DRAFT_716527 [Auriculariales sp. MPI-PUGE-AT-0066]|nr:hypothetical protein BKA62DRAFT_716527 [Auriculariales sp. MPI-PUGE-AT-0066]
MRWSAVAVTACVPATVLALAASNNSQYSYYVSRPGGADECFNCLLPKFTCGQFAECNRYDGQCKCPDGWGGIDCLVPQCDSLKDGHNRQLRKDGEDCDCSEGWTGLNCNVCKSDAACKGFPLRSSDGSLLPLRGPDGSIRPMPPPSSLSEDDDESTPNMTCYRNGPTVIANHYMCDVTNPKIIDQLKEKKPQVTFSCDNATATCMFQFWIGSRESFYCGLDTCTSTLEAGVRSNTTRYDCEKLKCNCIPGRMMCGEDGSVDISEFLTEEIKGPARFQCKSGGGGCTFEEDAMNELISSIFSDPYITLSCDGGECLHYSQLPGYIPPPPTPYYFGPLWISAGVTTGVFILALILLWYFARPIQDGGVKLPSNEQLMADHVPAGLQFSNLSYTLGSWHVLDGVSGAVKPGQLLAIIGASGAGKSSLLDILARRQKRGNVSGNVLVNGREVSDSVFRRAAGYVDQEDTLMGTLTVYETVYYSALLRLPREMSVEAKRFRTLETLNELGILAIRDSRIGDSAGGHRGISGGEKRRVSIACELVTSPSILFLDEPTSGLDAYNALSVVQCLHRLAREFKRTVVFTIHQPRSNIVSLFDQLLVLTKGRVVYSGDMAKCQPFFADAGYSCPAGFNIADYLIDVTMENEDSVPSSSDATVAADRDADGRSVTSVVIDHRDGAGETPPPERTELHSITTYFTSRTSNLFSRSSHNTPVDAEQQNTPPQSGAATPRQRAVLRPLSRRIAQLATTYAESDVANDVKREIAHAQNTAAATANGALLGPGMEGEDDGVLKGRRRASWATQFRILSGRAFKNLYRDPALLATHYIAAIAIALISGYFYYHVGNNIEGFQNRLGLFFFAMALFSFSCLSSLGVFAKERVLFMRERANGYYSTFTYFSSKVLFDIIPLRVVPPLVFGGIVYGLVGLVPTVEAFWKFLLVLVLFNLTTASVCLLLAIVFEDVGVANLVGTLVMLFNLLFAGLLINRSSIAPWLRWLFTVSFFHAAYEALAVVDKQAGVSIEIPAATVLSLFGLRARWYWPDVSLLAGMFAGFTTLSFIYLHYFVKERR